MVTMNAPKLSFTIHTHAAKLSNVHQAHRLPTRHPAGAPRIARDPIREKGRSSRDPHDPQGRRWRLDDSPRNHPWPTPLPLPRSTTCPRSTPPPSGLFTTPTTNAGASSKSVIRTSTTSAPLREPAVPGACPERSRRVPGACPERSRRVSASVRELSVGQELVKNKGSTQTEQGMESSPCQRPMRSPYRSA